MKRIGLRLWFTASQRRRLEIFIYMLIMAAGCALGTLCMMRFEGTSLCRFCIEYGVPRLSADSAEVFVYSFLRNGAFWILSLFFGFCAIGQPCILGVLLTYGFMSGCCLAKAITVSAVLQYILTSVYTIIISFIMILAVREAMRLSLASFFVYIAENDASGMSKRLRLYFIRFGLLFFMILAASGIYAVCYGFLQ